MIDASSTEEPQLTPKLVLSATKQERFDELGCVALTACTTCDFSLITSMEEDVQFTSSSSEEELDEEVLDVSSLSDSQSEACGSLVSPSEGSVVP